MSIRSMLDDFESMLRRSTIDCALLKIAPLPLLH